MRITVVTPDQLTLQELTLQERVRQFNLGTPTAMHVGTHELVNDLWRELEMHRQPADANPSRPVRQHSGDRSAHTPGPWIVRWFNDGHAFIYDADQSFVANVVTGDAEGEASANARLIAAAPEMLNALEVTRFYVETLEKHLDPTCDDSAHKIREHGALIRAAIAKASGA